MNTPKNRQQQSTALSTTKKGPVRGLKNILVQPQELLWPILKEEKYRNELHSILTELLPARKCPPKEMNWSKLCRLSKEERSALKKESQAKYSEEHNNNIMTTVILGINGVTKALEKNNLCSVLVDSNVEPLFLVKHIVVMGQNKNIPVLLIPFLKTVTVNKIGFACAAFGIKKSVSDVEDEHFYKLHKKICCLVDVFTTAKQSYQLLNTDVNSVNSQLNDEKKCLLRDSSVEKNCNSPQKSSVSTCVYKYRSSCNERAFIPCESQPILVDKEELWTEFISLGGDETDTRELKKTTQMFKRTGRYMDIHESKEEFIPMSKDQSNMEFETVENVKPKCNIKQTTYIPLKVKRIQGNPKRLKATKIAKLKNKKVTKK